MANQVYRIVTAGGEEHAWHGTPAALQKTHPGATITGRLVHNDLGEGSWAPYGGTMAEPPVVEPVEPAAEEGAASEERPPRKAKS